MDARSRTGTQAAAHGRTGRHHPDVEPRASGSGIHRPPQNHALFDPAQDKAIIGRVVATGLSDEHRDRRYLVIDGIDGHSHYADIGEDQQAVRTGSIVRLSPTPIEVRDVDRAVAQIAAHHQGHYSIELHLNQDPMMTQGRAEMHVRRLEAMRRLIGAPERQPDGSWYGAAIWMRSFRQSG